MASALISCQEEYSFEGDNENIYKKQSNLKFNISENGHGENSEGGENREVTVQHAPFGFGLSAVLGAGALIAVKTARKRRKEEKASIQ